MAERSERDARGSGRPVRTARLLGFDGAVGDPAWTPFDDDVMGGRSRSRFAFSDVRTGLFEGRLSLANGGGFATIRTPELELDLAGWEGVRLRLCGDGRRYGFGLRESNRRGDPGVWRHELATVKDAWIERELCFADFELSVMGRRRPEAGRVDPARVRAFSLVIADGDEAPFRLELASIDLYVGASSRAAPP